MKLMFSCKIVHYEESLISAFQEFFASIKKTFILAGGLGTGLSFYGDYTLSWYFLISLDPGSYSPIPE